MVNQTKHVSKQDKISFHIRLSYKDPRNDKTHPTYKNKRQNEKNKLEKENPTSFRKETITFLSEKHFPITTIGLCGRKDVFWVLDFGF